MKLHENKQLFADAVRATAEMMGIAPEFVEKDYWICQILQRLPRHTDSNRIIWKGGTSLSKAYSLVKRFSSDVDFAVISEGLTQSQLKQLIARIGKDTTSDLVEKEIEGGTNKKGRYRKTYHEYDSVIAQRNARYNFLGNHVVVEINTYGNPFPHAEMPITTFIADMMRQRGLDKIISDMDMETFVLNVLDKRRTLCEKVASLLRFSFDDVPIKGLSARIRHFYDLYFLTQDEECKAYLQTDFAHDLLDLIEHDKREYDRPLLWRDADLHTSILFTNFDALWKKLAPLYESEVGALSYGDLPSKDAVAVSMKGLLERVERIIPQYKYDRK